VANRLRPERGASFGNSAATVGPRGLEQVSDPSLSCIEWIRRTGDRDFRPIGEMNTACRLNRVLTWAPRGRGTSPGPHEGTRDPTGPLPCRAVTGAPVRGRVLSCVDVLRPSGAVTDPDAGYGKMSDWSLRTRADATRRRRSRCEKADEGGHPQGVLADRERL